MSRLLCKLFGHRRNIHGVRRLGMGWRSTCIHCHQPLIRISRGAWQLGGKPEFGAPENHEQLRLFNHDDTRPRAIDR